MTMDNTARPDHTPDVLREAIAGLEENALGDSLAAVMEPLAERLDEGDMGHLLRGDWLGHAAHPMLTDLPLGCFMSASMLDLVGGKGSAKAAQRLIGVGLLALPAVSATGLVDWKEASSDPRIRRVGAIHGAGNAVAGLLYFQSWRARRKGHQVRGMALALGGGVLALFTGYLGGHMSFARRSGTGERGLDLAQAHEGAPDSFVADWANEQAEPTTIDLIEEAPIPR